MRYISNYHKKITFLNHFGFLDKIALLNCVNELKNSLWLEIFFDFSNLMKKKKIEYNSL